MACIETYKPQNQQSKRQDVDLGAKSDILRDLQRLLHLVGILALGLLLPCCCQNRGVPADLGYVNIRSVRCFNPRKTNLLNQVKEITLRIRPICWCLLVGFVKSRDRGVEDADGSFAEFEVFERGTTVLLYAKMSKRAIRHTDVCVTYRCQEDQSPLKVAKVLDVLASDAGGDFFDEGVEFLQSLFAKDRLDDVLVDLLTSVLAEALLLCCGRNPGE